jgi:hypothetical protein
MQSDVIKSDPLIWTVDGNVLVSMLRYETAWEDTTDFITFHERYYDGDRVVRSSAHVYSKRPLEFQGEQGGLN